MWESPARCGRLGRSDDVSFAVWYDCIGIDRKITTRVPGDTRWASSATPTTSWHFIHSVSETHASVCCVKSMKLAQNHFLLERNWTCSYCDHCEGMTEWLALPTRMHEGPGLSPGGSVVVMVFLHIYHACHLLKECICLLFWFVLSKLRYCIFWHLYEVLKNYVIILLCCPYHLNCSCKFYFCMV